MKKIMIGVLVMVLVVALYFIFSQNDLSVNQVKNDPDMQLAQSTLENYFSLLNIGKYSEAVIHHGSGYDALMDWNPDLTPKDRDLLLQRGCEQNGWQCLRVREVLSAEKVNESVVAENQVVKEYKFTVQFNNNDGTLFKFGPCCGATEAEMPTRTEFEYIVKKADNGFIVMTAPQYRP